MKVGNSVLMSKKKLWGKRRHGCANGYGQTVPHCCPAERKGMVFIGPARSGAGSVRDRPGPRSAPYPEFGLRSRPVQFDPVLDRCTPLLAGPLSLSLISSNFALAAGGSPQPTIPLVVAAPIIYPTVSLPPLSLCVGYSGLGVRVLGMCEASVRVKKAPPLSFVFV